MLSEIGSCTAQDRAAQIFQPSSKLRAPEWSHEVNSILRTPALKNISRNLSKFSRHGDPAYWICASLIRNIFMRVYFQNCKLEIIILPNRVSEFLSVVVFVPRGLKINYLYVIYTYSHTLVAIFHMFWM
jgi:hypothetical protein